MIGILVGLLWLLIFLWIFTSVSPLVLGITIIFFGVVLVGTGIFSALRDPKPPEDEGRYPRGCP